MTQGEARRDPRSPEIPFGYRPTAPEERQRQSLRGQSTHRHSDQSLESPHPNQEPSPSAGPSPSASVAGSTIVSIHRILSSPGMVFSIETMKTGRSHSWRSYFDSSK